MQSINQSDRTFVESHHGTVFWYAPIELAAGIDPAKLKIAGQLYAQPCDANNCLRPQSFTFTAQQGAGLEIPKKKPEEKPGKEPGAKPAEPAPATTPQPKAVGVTKPEEPVVEPAPKEVAGEEAHINWRPFTSIAALDIKTLIYPFGRPEMGIANVMAAQIARHFGASFSGHAGLTDSKLPSVESGMQKVMTGMPTLLAGGNLWIDAGLLATDEVYSPIQLILDNEMVSALKHFTTEFEVSEASIGLETILEAGPGGGYLDKLHTVKYMRQERWMPKIWSRVMLGPWQNSGSKLDVDLAREFALEVKEKMSPYEGLGAAEERAILDLIERARIDLGL